MSSSSTAIWVRSPRWRTTMARSTASRRARNSASVTIGGRRRPDSRPSRRRCRLASSRVEPLTARTSSSARGSRPGGAPARGPRCPAGRPRYRCARCRRREPRRRFRRRRRPGAPPGGLVVALVAVLAVLVGVRRLALAGVRSAPGPAVGASAGFGGDVPIARVGVVRAVAAAGPGTAAAAPPATAAARRAAVLRTVVAFVVGAAQRARRGRVSRLGGIPRRASRPRTRRVRAVVGVAGRGATGRGATGRGGTGATAPPAVATRAGSNGPLVGGGPGAPAAAAAAASPPCAAFVVRLVVRSRGRGRRGRSRGGRWRHRGRRGLEEDLRWLEGHRRSGGARGRGTLGAEGTLVPEASAPEASGSGSHPARAAPGSPDPAGRAGGLRRRGGQSRRLLRRYRIHLTHH